MGMTKFHTRKKGPVMQQISARVFISILRIAEEALLHIWGLIGARITYLLKGYSTCQLTERMKQD